MFNYQAHTYVHVQYRAVILKGVQWLCDDYTGI